MAATHLSVSCLQGKVAGVATRKPFAQPLKSAVSIRPRRSLVAARPAASLEALVTAVHPVIAALDWSDPDTQIGALGAFAGLALGIGAPIFYVSRDVRDEERLEELRALNRATKAETGEYLTDEEIEAIRPARWTDRREFVDDD